MIVRVASKLFQNFCGYRSSPRCTKQVILRQQPFQVLGVPNSAKCFNTSMPKIGPRNIAFLFDVDSAIIVDVNVHVFLFGRACPLNRKDPASFPAGPFTPRFISINRQTRTSAPQACMGRAQNVYEAPGEMLLHHTSVSFEQRVTEDKSSADVSLYEESCPTQKRL